MNDAVKLSISSDVFDDINRFAIVHGEPANKYVDDFAKGYSEPGMALFAEHLFPDPPQSPLHLRRTLDQFQYYMNQSTEDRDTDQVITRYFQRRHPKIPLPIMMVDQMWMWILNSSKICWFH